MRFELVVLLFFVVGTKLIHVFGKPLSLVDVTRTRHERDDDSSRDYLLQCGEIFFPKAQRGFVNVLAFLDSSWPYSHRQAIMFKMLQERFQRSGLPDVRFYVINADQTSPRKFETSEDMIEKEAWLGVSPDEIDNFSNLRKFKITDSIGENSIPDIEIIQDNDDYEIWKRLRGSRDQVLVADRCGKLAYQVIVPWSILHFPYVKAAILSTYNDEPCGICDFQTEPQKLTMNYFNEFNSTTEQIFNNYTDDYSTVTTEYSSATESTELDSTTFVSLDDSNIPAKIINPDLEPMEANITPTTDSNPTTIETSLSTPSKNSLLNTDPTNSTDTTTDSNNNNHEITKSSTEPIVEFITEKSVILESDDKDEFIVDKDVTTMTTNDEYTNILVNVATADRDREKSSDLREIDRSSIDENSITTNIPIRIIMHAPHFHVDGDSTRMHEYLVLRTGTTDRHRHLAGHGATKIYRGPQDHHEITDYHRYRDVEEKTWPMTNVIYNRDESPGLYGEVADYWKNSGNHDNDDYNNGETDNLENYGNTEEPDADVIIWRKPVKMSETIVETDERFIYPESKFTDVVPDRTTEKNEKSQSTDADDVILKEQADAESSNDDDDELRSQLIAHYSKLLPWIYYTLD